MAVDFQQRQWVLWGDTGAVGPREPGALVMGSPLSREGGLFFTFFFF